MPEYQALENRIIDLSYLILRQKTLAATQHKLHDMSNRDLLILEMLDRKGTISFSELNAQFPAITDSTLSASIAELCKNNLVKKELDPANARGRILTITDTGKERLSHHHENVRSRMAAMFTMIKMNEVERQCCTEIVNRAIEEFSKLGIM